MKFVVWGAGTEGKRFCKFIDEYTSHDVCIFIDISSNVRKNKVLERDVITYDEYRVFYKDLPIVICMANKLEHEKVKQFLVRESVVNFSYYDCVGELFYPLPGGIPFSEMLNHKNITRLQKIGIFGKSLFAVMLYDYMKENGYSIVLAYNEYDSVYEHLHKNGYICVQINTLHANYYTILHTEEVISEINMQNVEFNYFCNMPIYKNESLVKFKDLYKNEKRCFIVATGPSLNIEDLDILHNNNEICISMNKIYLAFMQTKWRPNILLIADPYIPDANIDDIMNADVQYKIIGDGASSFWDNIEPDKEYLHKIHVDYSIFPQSFPRFSHDLVFGLCNGRTVTYGCIQLAVYLGIKEIYLLGLDCAYKKTVNDDENHFIKGYSATNTVPGNGVGTYMLHQNSYQKAKSVAEKLGVKIYNASRYTELDVFERVDFDSLFD